MTSDSASLDNLRDIVVPPAPPMWPPAPGFWVLLFLCTMIGTTVLWYVIRHRQQNAYRRAGTQLLNDAKTVQELNQILKRVALAIFPREEVAPLYGAEWTHFLAKQCPGRNFDVLVECGTETASEQQHALARQWIQQHQRRVH
ncbi:DUF4381 domain-containing protein [Coraliomargarita akajimensis]|uniref:DUF4381 domain-containing protein n=1 Tax=Coraliomargarita akajimensis (strain DSM 45221 / IAM 15411 / JCM 23193 / KCTC 12865 / 04OKA010-24) TaxID=583355 RepID=D5EM49_CORAD|nr:DUF4381 domain-containing protein [Coraliomargarita akajimensis]ADE55209.1 hypothetical protein Caka_2192 [Coraliomargarita akajimensis DSM 45221]